MFTASKIANFQQTVWDYYRQNRRQMPWRDTTDPYKIVVSEVMLQQTQVNRVLGKYSAWMTAFPDFETLATAPAARVLQMWQGLGYNRRALNVHKLAQIVVRDYAGKMPEHPSELIKLPGIGAGTAGSIAVFAFNAPAVFIETNIRRVYIHHFFVDRAAVNDQELLPLIEQTLDRKNPREWYYALMDYGAHVAETVPNPNRRSKHYAKQTKFEGSDRQARGKLLRQLLNGPKTLGQLIQIDDRAESIVPVLEREGFIARSGRRYTIAP